MKITSIIENTSQRGLPTEHGLSLFIEKDDGQKILFDMGQSSLFARNAETIGVSIADVDIAVISHGHYDHGGGLKTFLAENEKAKVLLHRDAFESHYSLRETGLRYIGLDKSLKDNLRLVFCDDETRVGEGMTLFADVHGNCCNPTGNRLLFGPIETINDSFSHEQNLVIEEADKVVLFAGCAHCGIVNILRKAEALIGKTPTHVFSGMHLVNRRTKQEQNSANYGYALQEGRKDTKWIKSELNKETDNIFISRLATELQKYDGTMFYTMHCTGEEQFAKLKLLMGKQIEYLSCGTKAML